MKPLKIGNLTVGFPVVLAPLAGYSDLPYRTICRLLGAPFATTEVMIDRFLLHESKLRRFILKTDDGDHPVGGQFMGSDPDLMAQAARVVRDLGFDVVDLNFACPVKKVVSRKRGGFMMTQPEAVVDIVRRVRDAVPDRPLMLKLRRSFVLEDGESEAFWRIAEGAFEVGADALCVHARAVAQQYTGRADWNFLSAVKRAFPDKTIIGSGDVSSAAEALRMIDETGVDGAAAARGAIGNPWIFRQARELDAGRPALPPTLAEQREVLLRHYNLCLRHYGDWKGVMTMRHLGIGYARVHPHPKRVRMAFVAVRTAGDWQAVLETHYPAG
ncbi:MAG: tRNA-dihydrouridine synthase [Candidatus Aminicenantes bacterium]|nr:tRNA-dihydrouridine synthase [Candidatus Aminicenantes bacterium]